MVGPFVDLVGELNGRSSSKESDFPTVSCIVSDGVMIFCASPAAKKYQLPIINLWPVSAATLMCGRQYSTLLKKGVVPLKGN